MKKNHKQSDTSGDSDELRELLGSVARGDQAVLFGVSVATLQAWLDGCRRPPAAVLSLCRLRYSGDLSEILGKDWCEVRITAAGLTLPGWRRPFSAGELRSTFFRLQRLTLLEHENGRLRAERSAAWQAQVEAESAAQYYRQQLRLESRLASILQAVTA